MAFKCERTLNGVVVEIFDGPLDIVVNEIATRRFQDNEGGAWSEYDDGSTTVEVGYANNGNGTYSAPAPRPIADIRGDANAVIDEKAEIVRLRFITAGAGQAATYLVKEQQAREYAAAGYSGPVPAMVSAKAAAATLSAEDAANLIIATADQWKAVAATIEQIREGGKAAVELAGNESGVTLARDSAVAQLDAIQPS